MKTVFDFRTMTVTFGDGRKQTFKDHQVYEQSPSYMIACFFGYPPSKREVIA